MHFLHSLEVNQNNMHNKGSYSAWEVVAKYFGWLSIKILYLAVWGIPIHKSLTNTKELISYIQYEWLCKAHEVASSMIECRNCSDH